MMGTQDTLNKQIRLAAVIDIACQVFNCSGINTELRLLSSCTDLNWRHENIPQSFLRNLKGKQIKKICNWSSDLKIVDKKFKSSARFAKYTLFLYILELKMPFFDQAPSWSQNYRCQKCTYVWGHEYFILCRGLLCIHRQMSQMGWNNMIELPALLRCLVNLTEISCTSILNKHLQSFLAEKAKNIEPRVYISTPFELFCLHSSSHSHGLAHTQVRLGLTKPIC